MKFNIFTVLLLPIILPLYIVGLFFSSIGTAQNNMLIMNGVKKGKKWYHDL